jgi:hypothetical protein
MHVHRGPKAMLRPMACVLRSHVSLLHATQTDGVLRKYAQPVSGSCMCRWAAAVIGRRVLGTTDLRTPRYSRIQRSIHLDERTLLERHRNVSSAVVPACDRSLSTIHLGELSIPGQNYGPARGVSKWWILLHLTTILGSNVNTQVGSGAE